MTRVTSVLNTEACNTANIIHACNSWYYEKNTYDITSYHGGSLAKANLKQYIIVECLISALGENIGKDKM